MEELKEYQQAQGMTSQYEAFFGFFNLCQSVEEILQREWKNSQEIEKQQRLEREKRAIMGYEEDIAYYMEKIENILRSRLNYEHILCPPWYKGLAEGIFAELYGFAGLTPWIYDETEEYQKSSSAKLIGDRLYCLIDGKSTLQPQRIARARREQLKRALLLATPRERLEKGFHEVYLKNGIRITIYSGDRTKENQDIMVFRKYVLRELTLEKMASLGTIPPDSVELFKTMIRLGFNVLFTGQVRAGKTAFMQCWQRYEDQNLEGMAIATDPETPWHALMPEAPIMQLVADGQELDSITKSLLRGDNDYVLLEEMRDAAAFKLALDITSTGTMRSKATIHAGSPQDIPYKMASAIFAKYGGDFQGIILQVFRNFNYVLEFYQEPSDRSKKRLKSVSELRYDEEQGKASIHYICKYDAPEDIWRWKYDMGEDKKAMGKLQPDEFKKMESMLKALERRNPIMENSVIYPRYYKGSMNESAMGTWGISGRDGNRGDGS